MAIKGIGPKSVEEAVQIYLRENPEIFMALEQNLLNISKLSKNITEENRQLNPISVRAALIRMNDRKIGVRAKNKADELLRKSKISLQDKVSVVNAKKPLHLKYISATFLEGSVVYIVDEMEQKLPQESEEVSVDSHVSMIHIY